MIATIFSASNDIIALFIGLFVLVAPIGILAGIIILIVRAVHRRHDARYCAGCSRRLYHDEPAVCVDCA